MKMYCRTFLIIALTLGMANAPLSEDECVTLKCSDMHVDHSTSPHVSVGTKYPNEELTYTICPTQKTYYDWKSKTLDTLEDISESEYTFYAPVFPSGNIDRQYIDRISKKYNYFRLRGEESVNVVGNCSKIELQPIPEDANKPKF